MGLFILTGRLKDGEIQDGKQSHVTDAVSRLTASLTRRDRENTLSGGIE